jgi:hypothetical protein
MGAWPSVPQSRQVNVASSVEHLPASNDQGTSYERWQVQHPKYCSRIPRTRRNRWTIHHANVHLIPRRQGDVQEPRGDVRGVIPGKANY